MLEGKKGVPTYTIVKAAAQEHKTGVNRLGYSPLQLVTGKAVAIPSLSMGNEANERVTDSEAVQRTIETINKTIFMF